MKHALAWVLCLLAGKTLFSDEPNTQPNVLFFFADDQRADTIAALGNPHIRTPVLDQLVRNGLSFERAYMQGGLHGATCVPSRAMLLSGRSLFRVDEKLKRDKTWPKAFSEAGYTTFISGKWHNGPESVPLSFQKAQKLFLGGMTDPMKARLSSLEGGKMGPAQPAGKHACEVFADEAIAFLTQHKTGPFFCYIPFDGPHDPHIVPADFPVHYDPNLIPLPPNFLTQHPFDNGEMTVRDEALLSWPREEKATRQMLADYYRYISYLDFQMGRVLACLDQSSHAKNTLVIFAADSGVARGSHGLIGKQNLYEHSVRVPVIIKGPGVVANQKTRAMCYLFDLFPTLGEVCRVPAPDSSEGISFRLVFADPQKPARDSLFFAYRNLQRGIRQDQWKLIRYPQIHRNQLFNLETDPQEIHDLSRLPEHKERVAQMTEALAKEQIRFGDKAPLSVSQPARETWSPPRESKKKTSP